MCLNKNQKSSEISSALLRRGMIVRDLSGVGEIFELIPLESPENLAFFAGDFETGYLNDAYTDAITPSCTVNPVMKFWNSVNLFKISVKSISDNDVSPI